jgi:hypothetical protein
MSSPRADEQEIASIACISEQTVRRTSADIPEVERFSTLSARAAGDEAEDFRRPNDSFSSILPPYYFGFNPVPIGITLINDKLNRLSTDCHLILALL